MNLLQIFLNIFLLFQYNLIISKGQCTEDKNNYAPRICLRNTPIAKWDGFYSFVGCDYDYPYYINYEKTAYIIYSYNYEYPVWYLYVDDNIYCTCASSSLLDCGENYWSCIQDQKYSYANAMSLSICEDDGPIVPADQECRNKTKTICIYGPQTQQINGEYIYYSCQKWNPYYYNELNDLYLYYNNKIYYWSVGRDISSNYVVGVCLNPNSNPNPNLIGVINCNGWQIYDGQKLVFYDDVVVVNATCAAYPVNQTILNNITESLPILNPNKRQNENFCCHGKFSTRDEFRCNRLPAESLCLNVNISDRCFWSPQDCDTPNPTETIQESCQCSAYGNRKKYKCNQIFDQATCLFRNCNWECNE